eukprot:CAMPEP_0115019708 /NCGR_PEP_ID=MMETSP0216-20121206/29621_1 /TAXON_ID=223996 /ORGANISM="Protocruzia adherens, Strain Boccale" /LENGTH=946 /DNA_ID=CAMNT_0002391263 /DNA_START=331 /DNA_END=3171 /DNA_ORIENTATION=-
METNGVNHHQLAFNSNGYERNIELNDSKKSKTNDVPMMKTLESKFHAGRSKGRSTVDYASEKSFNASKKFSNHYNDGTLFTKEPPSSRLQRTTPLENTPSHNSRNSFKKQDDSVERSTANRPSTGLSLKTMNPTGQYKSGNSDSQPSTARDRKYGGERRELLRNSYSGGGFSSTFKFGTGKEERREGSSSGVGSSTSSKDPDEYYKAYKAEIMQLQGENDKLRSLFEGRAGSNKNSSSTLSRDNSRESFSTMLLKELQPQTTKEKQNRYTIAFEASNGYGRPGSHRAMRDRASNQSSRSDLHTEKDSAKPVTNSNSDSFNGKYRKDRALRDSYSKGSVNASRQSFDRPSFESSVNLSTTSKKQKRNSARARGEASKDKSAGRLKISVEDKENVDSNYSSPILNEFFKREYDYQNRKRDFMSTVGTTKASSGGHRLPSGSSKYDQMDLSKSQGMLKDISKLSNNQAQLNSSTNPRGGVNGGAERLEKKHRSENSSDKRSGSASRTKPSNSSMADKENRSSLSGGNQKDGNVIDDVLNKNSPKAHVNVVFPWKDKENKQRRRETNKSGQMDREKPTVMEQVDCENRVEVDKRRGGNQRERYSNDSLRVERRGDVVERGSRPRASQSPGTRHVRPNSASPINSAGTSPRNGSGGSNRSSSSATMNNGGGSTNTKDENLQGFVTRVPQNKTGRTKTGGSGNSNSKLSLEDRLYYEHLYNTIQSLKLVRNMETLDDKIIKDKQVFLERKSHHDKTIIFDLDETLVHCCDSLRENPDTVLKIKFPKGDVIEAGINIRPYARECLEAANEHFEVIVFTASHRAYANVVLDYLDPTGKLIQHRLFREHCIQSRQGFYVKDLRIFANRKMSQMAIVDNATYSFANQLDNGIPIISWYDNKEDTELKSLITYMEDLSKQEDVRELNKITFDLRGFMNQNSDQDIEKLSRKIESFLL